MRNGSLWTFGILFYFGGSISRKKHPANWKFVSPLHRLLPPVALQLQEHHNSLENLPNHNSSCLNIFHGDLSTVLRVSCKWFRPRAPGFPAVQTSILFLPNNNQHASLDEVFIRHESTLYVLGRLPPQFLQASHASLCLPFLDRPFRAENDRKSDRPSDLPSLPSLWGSPDVLATLRLPLGLGFGEPFDHVQEARKCRHKQWSEASEVQKGAEEASLSSIHALPMKGVTDKDYETQTLSDVIFTLWEAHDFSRKGSSL